MEKFVEQTLLYDFYGELLTERQQQVYESVVLEDYSLSEVAEDLGISRQLMEYEKDRSVRMDTAVMADLLYEYTSGYPYLVSAICKELDEEISQRKEFEDKKNVWSKAGFLEAVKVILASANPLFESLTDKLNAYPELKNIIYRLLFQGQSIAYNPDDESIKTALMFGLIKIEDNSVLIANRIFDAIQAE